MSVTNIEKMFGALLWTFRFLMCNGCLTTYNSLPPQALQYLEVSEDTVNFKFGWGVCINNGLVC